MHKYFADWYRIANVDFETEDLERRWKVIEQLVKDADANSALEWVRLFLGRPPANKDFLMHLGESFKKHDSAFPMKKNLLELRILCGASITHLLDEGDPKLACTGALALICAYCFGLRKSLIDDVVVRAHEYLNGRAIDSRHTEPSSKLSLPSINANQLTEAITAAQNSGNQATMNNTGSETFKSLIAAVAQISKVAGKAVKESRKEIEVLQEETNILWWLVAEYSRDLKKGYRDITFPAACLVAPKELADLTRICPGPVSAPAVLDKVLSVAQQGRVGQVAIKDAINATPRDWKALLVEETSSPIRDLCPLHIGIQESLKTKGENAWLPAFKTLTQIVPNTKCEPLLLSVQFYQERLLHSGLARIARE